MNKNIDKIMDIMNSIEYGFKDNNGINIINNYSKYKESYYLQSPDELLKTRCGVCFDQVELERKLFKELNIKFKTYFIEYEMSHTFLVYQLNNKYYWFEHAWYNCRGIHEYESENSLFLDIKKKIQEENNDEEYGIPIFIYEYEMPKYHLKCDEFFKYIETQKLIKINKPLYFYHLVNKDSDLKNGLVSLQYMYDNNMDDLFNKYVVKYKDRIINDWGIKKYKDKNNLTKEDYIDALNTFRGKYGSNYIYFFRYPPYKKLGPKIEELSKYKDIYRININDEEVQRTINDIFYGYDMSSSDNKLLDKKYYENISKTKYFSQYDDTLQMNFSKLNHIAISFINGNCPLKFLKKVDWKEE